MTVPARIVVAQAATEHRDGAAARNRGRAAVSGGVDAVHAWFLSSGQRGNRWTRLGPWNNGNAARPLVHGSEHFAAPRMKILDTY